MPDRQQIVPLVPVLRRYARALTGNAWAADDLVQDTLERACVKWRLWTAGSDLRAWLFAMMHNVYMNQLREPRQRAQHIAIDDEAASQLTAPARDTDDALDLDRALQALPYEQREIILMVALAEMSYAQVATALKIPRGTVMSRLSRARARLALAMDHNTAARTQADASAPDNLFVLEPKGSKAESK